MNDLISVIIPVYKVEQYLDACVQSIVEQTYRNLEIILVDDGSPDSCPAMCDEWAKKDGRIRVIHKCNGGASTARNAGLDVAQGDYIGFVDSDDMVRPDMYEIMLSAIYKSQKKMACCHGGWEPEASYDAKFPEILAMDVEEAINCTLSGRIGTSLWRRLYHRMVWENLRLPEGEINEDYPVLIPSIIAAGGAVEVREKLYFYRQTANSVTATFYKNKKNAEVILKNLSLMHAQIRDNHLNCMREYRNCVIRGSCSVTVAMDKNLHELEEGSEETLRQYLRLMRKLFFYAMFGNAMKMKEKILYCLVVTRTLRPVYRLLGKL